MLCFSSARVGLIVGSTQSLRCEFQATTGYRSHLHGTHPACRARYRVPTSASVLSLSLCLQGTHRDRPRNLARDLCRRRWKRSPTGPGLGANVLIGDRDEALRCGRYPSENRLGSTSLQASRAIARAKEDVDKGDVDKEESDKDESAQSSSELASANTGSSISIVGVKSFTPKETSMSDLVIVGFDNQTDADRVFDRSDPIAEGSI